jgi:hypothetical protein
MHPDIAELLEKQWDCLARWQLVHRGWRPGRIDAALRPLRRVHDGVRTTTVGPLHDEQRWMAATLTAPGSVLAYASAAAFWGFRAYRSETQFVVRRGRAGRRRIGEVEVSFSPDREAVRARGMLVVPPARVLLDLAPHVTPRDLRRSVLEALRLRCCVKADLAAVLERRRGVPGSPALRRIVEEVQDLPIERTRSNAEAWALHRAVREGRRPPDAINTTIAGFEADRIWWDLRLIEEIDGPGFHLDPVADAVRTAAWEGAGFTVTRRPSGDVYD